MPFLDAQKRQWLYGIVVAALPLLVLFKLINPEDVPLWLALVGAILGTGAAGTAFVAVRAQRKDGTLESTGKHSADD